LARRFANGLIDHEFHQVHVLELDWPLSAYRPDPTEVMGLAAFRSDELLSAASGRVAELRATEAVAVGPDGRLLAQAVVVKREALVPYSAARLRRMLGKP
jgi:hypothetical protein